ncbi:YlxQ family RNA-binding protein [Bacillus sp. PS06]|uniref:YlxQ family RNA-binding protein n=1 Tax=Bacillus sp. PS06 TaxID=2764176 RepID=UPI00177D9F63|nr:YlxQ family RNA-binding protein [Bacillus sp. PS06]MBD8068260.1 YlxQ family RNA-binding protein [Bacillus sp. PS06]
MNKNEKWVSFLGLANRARKVISGEELVIKGIRNEQVKLVLLAEDASTNTAKKVKDKSSYYHIPLRTVNDRYTLGSAIGKDARVVVAITDIGFANKLMLLLD